MTPQDTMRLALEALESLQRYDGTLTGAQVVTAIEALKAALSQQGEQQPVAKVFLHTTGGNVGLTTGVRWLQDKYGCDFNLPPGTLLYSAAPAAQPELTTCNCRWDGETQVQQCTLHEAHVAAIHEWAERAKTAEAALAQPDDAIIRAWQAGYYHAGYTNDQAYADKMAREYAGAAPAAQPVQGELDRQLDQLIQERDHRDEIINKLCDAVLGTDRYEWSSMYFFEDAVREVEERMAHMTPQPDARKVIEQMVMALFLATPNFGYEDSYRAAIQAGQKWLEENK